MIIQLPEVPHALARNFSSFAAGGSRPRTTSKSLASFISRRMALVSAEVTSISLGERQ